MDRFILWLAQGCGLGRIPWAPGTFGSLGGLLWVCLLLLPGSLLVYILITLLSILASVWICQRAEGILKLRDPSSVVIDEIVALPICFLPWVINLWQETGTMPPPDFMAYDRNWLPTMILFVLFRVFDIVKPWPCGASQKWPGGWGVTMDDILAGIYVALISLVLVV